jgi:hypothetical protein
MSRFKARWQCYSSQAQTEQRVRSRQAEGRDGGHRPAGQGARSPQASRASDRQIRPAARLEERE